MKKLFPGALVLFTTILTFTVFAGVASATSATTEPALSAAFAALPAATGHIVASGPGFVIVGEGAAIKPSTSGRLQPMSVNYCGWASCSLYLNRQQTHRLSYNISLLGGGLAALTASCALFALLTGPAAVVSGFGCAAVMAIWGGFILNAVSHADAENGCLRVRYGAPWLAGFYNDHSGYCHNT